MATTDAAPTTQRGVVTNHPNLPLPGGHGFTWGSLIDEAEHAFKLKWPRSIELFEQMLTDAQVNALRAAVVLPLKRRRWLIDPNGAEDRVVRHVADDLGLAVLGEDEQPKVISARRFSWPRHLHHVLLAPFMGHYFFSQYAPIADDGLAHLRKLLPLPPRTIFELRVEDDGGLDWIRQKFAPLNTVTTFGLPEPIPVSALVAYVWEQEAGNWLGRSMLRSVYRDWLAKDDLIRGNLIMHRRNGMGVPTARQTEASASPQALKDATAVARAWRVGEESSAGLPFGTDIELKGVQGTLPDAVPSIRLHDEAMARAFLAMFMQLGQTRTGSRALGTTFVDFFNLSLDAVAQELVCDTTTLHVIRDLVDWNYGEDAQCPILVSERDEDPELSVADLTALVGQGVLTVDPELEQMIRGRYGLPEIQQSASSPAPVGPPPSTAPPGTPPAASGGGRRARPFGRLRDRLRAAQGDAPQRVTRDPRPAEQHTDWLDLEDTWRAARDALVAAWQLIRNRHIDDLAVQIQQAGDDLNTLAALQATVSESDAEVIARRMRDIADYGALTVREEGASQGVTLPVPDMAPVRDMLNVRAAAVADLLGRAISEAAGRQAVQRTGGSLAPAEVASEVSEHLRGLSNAYLEEQLGGALTQGMNTGRRATMGGVPEGTTFEASELLDVATCSACLARDGKQYATLVDAELDYPVGGFKGCEGGVRCRGTLVMVLPESTPSVQ